MQYNIYFEASAVAYLVLLNLYVRIQYNSNSENNRRFQRLAAVLLTSTSLDVITGITISYGNYIPVWVNILLNTLYLGMNVVLGQTFLSYCIGVVRGDRKNLLVAMCQRIIYGMAFVVLVVNLFSGIIFTFDADGNYIHGKLYFLAFAVPIAFIMFSSLMLISGFRQFTKNQRTSVILYISTAVCGCIIQFMFPNVLFILFSISLGLLMLMFSMETPDYQSVQEALSALDDSRKRAELAMRRAQDADKAKSEFLTGVSHEIRTPINAILGYNGLIMKETEDASISEYAAKVKTAGDTLITMVSNLIDFGEIERGNVVIDSKPYDTAVMFRDVIGFAQYNADSKGLECILNIDAGIPAQLKGDSFRIKQIFNNIISNAAKYTEQGHIELHIRWYVKDNTKGVMFVDITDTGIGIRDEDLENIIHAFSRTNDSRNTSVRGIGMGLTIASRLLEKMGGTLMISSEYGKGTKVSFEIVQDIVDCTPMGAPEEEKKTVTDNVTDFTAPNARILAVDDNEINLDVLCRSIKSTGVTIDTAVDGEKALTLIGQNHYDLIFLDHMMPVMDGVETLKTIRRMDKCKDIPVVVVTANAVQGDSNYYIDIGFDEYLPKPVSRAQLMASMRRLLPSGLIVRENAAEENKAETEKKPVPAVKKAAPVPKKSAPKKAVPKKLTLEERFDFLDTHMGLSFCCEDEEFYLSMIESFVEGSRYDMIKELFDSKDYDNYRIQVHALKSAARTIGAAELGDKAEKLEKSQKAGDTQYVIDNNEEFMTDYFMLLEMLKAALSQDSEPVMDDDISEDADEQAVRSVLIIDDDDISVAIAEKMLSAEFDVSSCTSVKNAMAAIEEAIPDVIITDVRMENNSGFEFMEELKSDAVFGSIPVMVVSSDPSAENELRCFEMGAADYVRKPFSAQVLAERIHRL